MISLRKILPVLASAIFAFLVPAPAMAGLVSGQVSRLVTRASDGLQIVEIAGPITGRPNCVRAWAYFMIRDEKSDAGKAQYAMLMSAYLSGAKVKVEGAGTCLRWGDGEDIETVEFLQ